MPDVDKPRVPMEMDEQGVYSLRTESDQLRFARMLLENGVVSRKNYQSPLQLLTGIQTVKALGLQPMTALRQTGFANGQFITWGDIPLAVVRKTGQMEWMREFTYTVDKDGAYKERCFDNANLHLPPAGAVCIMKRRDEAEPYTYSYSVEDAKNAGLWGKGGPWSSYPQIMLMRRARAVCINKGFSDLTHCVATAENDIEGVPEFWADAKVREKIERLYAANVRSSSDYLPPPRDEERSNKDLAEPEAKSDG